MICKKCETILSEDAKFCPICGASVEAEPVPQPTVAPTPVQPQAKQKITEEDIPEQYQLMGPWSYFWLNILYSVPLVGFIFLIIFSFSKGNLNRRNYTRSFWCAWLVIAVITVVFFLIIFIIALITGSAPAIMGGSMDAATSTMMY